MPPRIDEGLVRDLATGAFLASQRNIVLVGGTGSGKSHLSIAIARNSIRGGARARFYNTTDLVNRLELETHQGSVGKLAEAGSAADFEALVSRESGKTIPDAKGEIGRALSPRRWRPRRSRTMLDSC